MTKPRLLTPAELEALRQDMEAAAKRMRAELARLRAQARSEPGTALATRPDVPEDRPLGGRLGGGVEG